MSSPVTVEKDGHVLLIGVNRPEKYNAWDLATIEAVGEAYQQLASDDDVRAGVLFGHGEHFSAGLDLAEVGPVVGEKGPQAISGDGEFDPFGVWKPQAPKPVVMAVSGIAFTLSIELALACDVVVCDDTVRFNQLEIGRGIMPFGGATLRATAQLGWGNAMRWLLTAEEFGAEEALRIGLVQEVTETGQHVERATAIAQRIAKQAPLGVEGTLLNARKARDEGLEAATEHLKEMLGRVMHSDDAKEGVASFLERREAEFTGR